MVVPLPLRDEEVMDVVEISPPAFRASIGLHARKAVAEGECVLASAAARRMIMEYKRLDPAKVSRLTRHSLLCIGLAALTGCMANRPEPIRPVRALDIPRSAYDGNVVEQLTGTLAYEHECLMFRDDNGGPLLTPVWPEGSSFDGTSVKYHEPGRVEEPILIAQHFVMGGRRVAWRQLASPAYAPFQNQCRGAPFLVSAIRPAD